MAAGKCDLDAIATTQAMHFALSDWIGSFGRGRSFTAVILTVKAAIIDLPRGGVVSTGWLSDDSVALGKSASLFGCRSDLVAAAFSAGVRAAGHKACLVRDTVREALDLLAILEIHTEARGFPP